MLQGCLHSFSDSPQQIHVRLTTSQPSTELHGVYAALYDQCGTSRKWYADEYCYSAPLSIGIGEWLIDQDGYYTIRINHEWGGIAYSTTVPYTLTVTVW